MTLRKSVTAPSRVAPSCCERAGPMTLRKYRRAGPMTLRTGRPPDRAATWTAYCPKSRSRAIAPRRPPPRPRADLRRGHPSGPPGQALADQPGVNNASVSTCSTLRIVYTRPHAPPPSLGYARVSSELQGQGSSLRDQQAVIALYAKAQGLPTPTFYVESESAIHERN